jgi:hypothetical protein
MAASFPCRKDSFSDVAAAARCGPPPKSHDGLMKAAMSAFKGWVTERTERHVLAPPFLSPRGNRRDAAWVSLPRHETALFGSERCGWRELEGIGAPGGGWPIRVSPECVEYMRVPLVAPLRVGAGSDGLIEASDDRHRHGRPGRRASHPAISTFRIASEMSALPSQNRAAGKPSLTLTRLILPSCTQAP